MGTVKTITFSATCGTEMPESFDLVTTAGVSGDLTLATAKVRASSESTGDKDYTYTCATMQQTSSDKESKCTKSKDGQKVYGEYSVKSIEDSSQNTLSLTGVSGNSFTLEKPFVVATEQTAKQTIDETTKTFTIKMTSGEVVPKFYPGNTATTKALSSCTLSELTVTCTPTSTEMEKDKEYKIYYQKPCLTEFTDTGITVTYKGTSQEGSSVFASISKISLIIAGLFLF